MRINNNIMALNTHRQLSINNTNMQKSLEKLSSGYRINRAGDDAAGLAISEKMRAQIRGLNMASKNAQDGISLIQTAEGGLNETHSILQKMRELAVQSSSDTNIEVDRGEIQKEVDQLAAEITRISNNTEFNTQKLLNGGIQDIKFHIGANEGQNISLGINAMDAYSLGVARDSVEASLASGATSISSVKLGDTLGTGIVSGASITISVTDNTGAKATATINDVVFSASTVGDTLNGKTITITQATEASTASKLEIDGDGNFTFTIGTNASAASLVTDKDSLVTEINNAITAYETANGPGSSGLASAALASDAIGGDTATVAGSGTLTGGADANPAETIVTFTSGANTETVVVADTAKSVTGTGAFEGLTFETSDVTAAAGTINITTVEAAAADVSDPNNIKEAVAPKGINVSTQEAADKAITVINKAIETVSAERSKLGAMQNRLEHTINNLDASAENLQAAESRIRDVDMAKEMMEFTKQNILTQAATAMLAQANASPQTVLKLLG
ncbi:MAG TPA: flagellin [Tepidanaerobacter syntrophicus]|uniref:flagellin N-terminal helical domain-containing protein n=1 Tax=Tepidanaerobacter syntrophicus TaxID=224999 RepID=UPI001758FBC4|nr:flagellin [Tepidanaerobacter syntrophicus]HHV82395.1 flagellin [Tepidanaerobacter syntrophicus]